MTNDMLIRIVRMHFKTEEIDTFLRIFEENKHAIRNFPGCTHLELLKDANNPMVYTTLSHWEDTKDLENYRKSELFKNVWSQVKVLFTKRTEAFSLVQYINL